MDTRADRPPSCPSPVPFSPSFLIASLVITLTLGAGSGLFYLWRIGLGAAVPLSHRQMHAHSQILGFLALYLMGIAYQALPRMLGGPPASARATRAVLWLIVAGVVLRNVGQPFAFFGFGGLLSFLSGLLAAAAGVLFALFVWPAVSEAARGGGGRDPLPLFVASGTIFFLLALALNVMQGAWIAGHRDATLPTALNEPFYVLSLYGFLLAFIYGLASRMIPAFLGTGPARLPVQLLVGLHALGALGLAAAWVPWLPGGLSNALRDGGLALLAVSALVFLLGTGVFGRTRVPRPRMPGSPEVGIRLAFGALGLWALLSLGGLVAGRLTRLPVQNPWWLDASRHVFTIGFLTLLIAGITCRVLPVFSRKPLFSARLSRWTYGLLVLGTGMRLLQYPAAYEPRLYAVASYMGIPVVLALVFFAVNVLTASPSDLISAAAQNPGASIAHVRSGLTMP